MTQGMVHGYLLGRLILRSAGFGCMASMDMQDFIDVSLVSGWDLVPRWRGLAVARRGRAMVHAA
jgi:hypothetical protein